jgi:hypothetical protein
MLAALPPCSIKSSSVRQWFELTRTASIATRSRWSEAAGRDAKAKFYKQNDRMISINFDVRYCQSGTFLNSSRRG